MPPTRSHTPPPPSSATNNLMRMSTIEIPLGHHQPPDLIAHHHSIPGLKLVSSSFWKSDMSSSCFMKGLVNLLTCQIDTSFRFFSLLIFSFWHLLFISSFYFHFSPTHFHHLHPILTFFPASFSFSFHFRLWHDYRSSSFFGSATLSHVRSSPSSSSSPRSSTGSSFPRYTSRSVSRCLPPPSSATAPSSPLAR